MKIKKILSSVLVGALAISMVGCGAGNKTVESDPKKIVIGATAVPHAEILEEVKPILKEKGFDLEIKVFDDYSLLNTAVDEGSLDANFFQHSPFLEESNKSKKQELVSVATVHLEPMGLYSKKVTDINSIEDGAEIAVPNDPTNETRALKLLEQAGLIKVNDGELLTINDITENPKNLKITELQAEQLPRVLEDISCAVINTNFALQANLNPTNDSLIIEPKDSPFANLVVVRKGDESLEKITALKEVINSEEIKKFIEEKYEGNIVPAF